LARSVLIREDLPALLLSLATSGSVPPRPLLLSTSGGADSLDLR
jgi:hypothetical protein